MIFTSPDGKHQVEVDDEDPGAINTYRAKGWKPKAKKGDGK